MGKTASRGDDTEPKITVTSRFQQDEWGAFQRWCRARGISHSDELRMLIRERMAKRLVLLAGLKAETIGELQEHADELGVEYEDAVKRILADFLAQRRKQPVRKER